METESEGPFVLTVGGEEEARPLVRGPDWSDADDRRAGRRPRDQSGAGSLPTVLVYPPERGANERIFLLQNYKIDGAALRPNQRVYLADVARWIAGAGGTWQVFAEAHASRTGAAQHDDALSEDRFHVFSAALAAELARNRVDPASVRVTGEGVGFRHSPLPGEDPRARSVFAVVQPLPSPTPPQPWPPRGVPKAWPPVPVPPVAGLLPPRWGPILRPRLSPHAALRTGNAVRHLIDGVPTFLAMAEAMRTAASAEHYIYLLGWQLVDDFELVRGDPSSTFKRLVADAAARGVQIRAMLWAKPIDPMHPIPPFDNRAQVDFINKLATGGAIRDNETPSRVVGAHHQKVLIVKGRDGLIGFCGGLDINKDRVAVVGTTAGEPLHDVHARISGPASWDLLQTFIRRWDHHPGHGTIDRKAPLLGRAEPLPPVLASVAVGPASSVPRTCSAIVARTFTPVTPGSTVPKERDIKTLFLEAVARAERFIYIEDQYLVSLDAAAALHAVVPRLAHLTILIPASESTDMPCRWHFRKQFIDRLVGGLSATDAAKVRIFQRVTLPITTPPTFGFHTYIHAKMWIFDDELAAIGSANVNRRGWESDSEADAFVFDDTPPEGPSALTFAQDLRMKLWSEHLGLPAGSFTDGVASAAVWLAPPASAAVMRYNPTGGRDIPPDAVCDATRGTIDPGLP